MISYRYNPDLPFIRKNWQGNPVIKGRFCNGEKVETPPFWEVWRWVLSPNPQHKEKKSERYKVPVSFFSPDLLGEDKLIWLGHSAFFIRLNGINFITDPCLFRIFSYKRYADLPFDPSLLRGIDYILLSHDHRDHIQIKALKMLFNNNPHLKVLTSLNAGRLLKSGKLKYMPVQEAGWYQKYETNPKVEVVFLPSKHWGRRFIGDYNKTLWGSFMLRSGNKLVYFAGDTAASPVFHEIYETIGAPDICMLPISAYAPDFIMKRSHTTPEEAFDIFKTLKAKTFIPMHYGTYDLSNEPLGEPIRRLKKVFEDQSLSHQLRVPAIGEAVLF